MTKKRLLADVVSLTPSNYEDFTRCARLFYNAALLGIPASDAAPSTDQGLLVHDMLWKVHEAGSCNDDANVVDVLQSHGAESPGVREMIARHARRCPSAASERGAHEQGLAAFHKTPPPMFMATARIDAIWIHDGVLDARDYKTGGRFADRVADITPPMCRRLSSDRLRAGAGCACGCGTSTCRPRSTTIPNPGSSTTTISPRSKKSCELRSRACGRRRVARRRRREPVSHVPLPVDLSRQRDAERTLLARVERRRVVGHL
jgi:hypothetical protein